MRLFLGIPVGEEISRALGEAVDILRAVRAPVRWVKPDDMHLTVKFLGETPAEKTAPLVEALSDSCAKLAAFTLDVRGLGAYPGLSRPRVLWAGASEPTGMLQRLREEVEAAAAVLGWPRERRPFSPHVTIGRVKGAINMNRLAEAMRPMQDRDWGAKDVGEMVLYRSRLTRDGVVYEDVHRFVLGRVHGGP